ncbi:MAG TPA: hypothetical protein VGL28_07275 [Steroidobacteraceae bacterium]|jgi:hypothetical protein
MRHAVERALGTFAVLLCGTAHASIFDGTWSADMSTARMLVTGRPQVIRVQDGQYACPTCDPPLMIRADGTDQPTSGSSHADTVSIAVLDERSVIETRKRGGKTVAIRKFTVSDDGGSAISEVSDYTANGTAVTSRVSWLRQSAGPPGSHAVSGSWVRGQPLLRDNAVTVTFSVAGNSLAMRASTGASYAAPLSGEDALYAGDPGIDTVSVRKISAREIQETDKKAGRAVQTWRWIFDATGRSGRVTWLDMATHTTTQALVRKIE